MGSSNGSIGQNGQAAAADKPLPRAGLESGAPSPSSSLPPEIAAFRFTQDVARAAARRVFERLEEGVTEIDAASELEAELKRQGVRCWLHKPFAWFGDRTCFRNFWSDAHFLPSKRRLAKDDAVILDVGPAVDGFPCDYALSTVFGEDAEVAAMKAYCDTFKQRVVEMLARDRRGSSLFASVGREIAARGYEARHTRYPLRVLGHKLERFRFGDKLAIGRPFQLPFFLMTASQLRRGENPFLNEHERDAMTGVWAIEPHLGNGRVGAKFEELLWVHEGGAEWLL
jgi:Xaa-Pro aminopeptidase